MSLSQTKHYWVVGNENSSVFELTDSEMLEIIESGKFEHAPLAQQAEFVGELNRRKLNATSNLSE